MTGTTKENLVDDLLKVVTALEPIVVPIISSNRDVKHDVKVIA
ncbi:hypothetical protein [Conexibacter woesei]|nr:hypothetical protein [Conexibacter woesei]